MTDYRNFRPGHDLRSQLGLTDAQQSRMSKLDEALRFEPKPLDPAKATLKPIINVTVNSNDLPLDAAGQKIHDEIVRMFGRVPNSIKVSHVEPDVLLDARAIRRLMPDAGLCINGTPVNVYVANRPGSDPLPVKDTDITRPGGLTSDIASALLALSKDKQIQGTDASLVMNVDEAATPGSKWTNLAGFAIAGTLAKGGPINTVPVGRMIPIGISVNHRASYLDLDGNEDSINLMLKKADAIAGVDEEGVRAAKQKFAEAFSLLTKALQDQ